MHGAGHLHGDGMAIWFTEERAETGQVFGFRDRFNGLGIFVDTYKNGRTGVVFPYVMAMLGNSSVSYNKDDDGLEQELAGCSVSCATSESSSGIGSTVNRISQARGLRTAEVPTKMKITYYQETSLRVDLQYKALDEWTECFETGPIKLPKTYYLGFTGETGELTDKYDIISVSSHNLYIRQSELPPGMGTPNKPVKPSSTPYNPGGDKERGSWRWFFLKIVLFGVAVMGSYVGWTMYRTSKRGSRF